MSLAQLQASSCPSSVLGKGHVDVDVDVDVEKKKNTVEAAAGLVRSGLVSLRRRREEEEEEEVQEQEQEQAVRPGQEVEEVEAVRAVEKEGEAPHVQGEEVLAREQNSLDAQVDWTQPVEWIGTVRERSVAGADVGNRLYAGKKRMFKGHKWERMRERRVGRTEMLLRDMDNRIQRFKGVRCVTQIFSSPPPFSQVFLFTDRLLIFSFLRFFNFFLVPCQERAIAASKEEERVEEDAEVAVLSACA